jgi:hypothetical protein
LLLFKKTCLFIRDGHSSASSKLEGSIFDGLPLVPSNDSLFGQPNVWNLGGQDTLQLRTAVGAFGQQQSFIGTTIKFISPTGTDTMMTSGGEQSINIRHQCITFMKEYENKSIEELRLEDYSTNRKGSEDQILDAQICRSAAALAKVYNNIKKEKDDLEAKLNKAKILIEKISKLKSGKEFLSENDVSQLDYEISIKTSKINCSSVAELEIRILEEEIDKIKSSGRFVPPPEKVQIINQIEAMQMSVGNAAKVQEEISKAEKDSDFCSEEDIEKLQKKFDSFQEVYKKLQCLNSGRVSYCNIMINMAVWLYYC